jgi:hypothetical protein
MAVVQLDGAQRRALGNRFDQLLTIARELSALGLDSDAIPELEAAVMGLAADTEAIMPTPPQGRVRALAMQALVITHEMRPSALRSYGSFSDESEARLSERVEQIIGLATRLVEDVDRDEAGEGSV